MNRNHSLISAIGLHLSRRLYERWGTSNGLGPSRPGPKLRERLVVYFADRSSAQFASDRDLEFIVSRVDFWVSLISKPIRGVIWLGAILKRQLCFALSRARHLKNIMGARS